MSLTKDWEHTVVEFLDRLSPTSLISVSQGTVQMFIQFTRKSKFSYIPCSISFFFFIAVHEMESYSSWEMQILDGGEQMLHHVTDFT